MRIFGVSVLSSLLFALPFSLAAQTFESDKHRFQAETITSDLDRPWGMAFVPNGDMLITERSGQLRVLRNGQLLDATVEGLPEIKARGQGGLLDVALHPDFVDNQMVYLSYSGRGDGGYSTEVLRGKLQDMTLTDVEVVFVAQPKSRAGEHYGSRLLFAPDGMLYISLGDRGHRPNGQDTSTHAGSLIRIHPDGRVPDDNPFASDGSAKPEIYTYGNRNMQGMALNPHTQEIWTHEHGPQGGDEVNIMNAGDKLWLGRNHLWC